MQKITLKPVTKELLYKSDEVNTHFDVLTYAGASAQERALGSLYLIGHIKYDEEDLGYVVSLISSLAKREYYSEASLKAQDPKKAFEGSLKKLNEVLEDFFKNKNFALNVGLAAIAGDQLYISKLGKFKVGLARNGEYIDVLNNLDLFQKSDADEEQFSNIISGSIQPGDKIFAYYPARSLTLREKSLQSVLLKENQDQFGEKIATLAASTENFNCCGVHIAIEQIKEIPVQTYAIPAPAVQLTSATEEEQPVALETPKPRVVAAELSVSKKSTIFSKATSTASRFRMLNRLPIHMKFRGFIIIAAIIVVPLLTIALIRTGGDSSDVKAAYNGATDSLKLAKAKLADNNPIDARTLIEKGLAQIGTLDNKKLVAVKAELNASLDSIDHISTIVPTDAGTLTAEQLELSKTSRMLATDVWFNNAELLTVKTKSYKLQDPATATDATLYEGNLYVLSGNHIYKYADALTGGTKRSDWGTIDATLMSIAVDGNLFGLTSDGKINMYFKGQKKSEFAPGLPINDGNRIATSKDGTLIYLANPITKRLYALDKTAGTLQATYKLDTIGDLKDMTVTSDGHVTMLSTDGKLWSIATQP